MFKSSYSDLVRCPRCGNMYPDHTMEYTGYGQFICTDCFDDMEEEDKDYEDE